MRKQQLMPLQLLFKAKVAKVVVAEAREKAKTAEVVSLAMATMTRRHLAHAEIASMETGDADVVQFMFDNGIKPFSTEPYGHEQAGAQ